MDPLRAILETLPRRLPATAAPSALAMAWRLAAGEALAARCGRLELNDGVLQVETAEAGDAGQLQSVAPELLRALNRMLGDGRVRRLRIRCGGPA